MRIFRNEKVNDLSGHSITRVSERSKKREKIITTVVVRRPGQRSFKIYKRVRFHPFEIEYFLLGETIWLMNRLSISIISKQDLSLNQKYR